VDTLGSADGSPTRKSKKKKFGLIRHKKVEKKEELYFRTEGRLSSSFIYRLMCTLFQNILSFLSLIEQSIGWLSFILNE